MKRMLDGGLDAAILCTGGDTLLALMRAVGVAALTPVRELATGAVLTDSAGSALVGQAFATVFGIKLHSSV